MNPGARRNRDSRQFRSTQKCLCPGWHADQQRIATGGIQFPENIIQQEQGRVFVFVVKERGDRQFQGKGDCPSLAFGSIGSSKNAIQQKHQIISLRADPCLAQTYLFLATRGESLPHRPRGSRLKTDLQRFARDSPARILSQRRKHRDQILANTQDPVSRLGEWVIIGIDLAAGTPLAEKQIPGTQGTVVVPEIAAITRITLSRLKSRTVEQLAPSLGGSIDQKEIIASKPDDCPELEILGA